MDSGFLQTNQVTFSHANITALIIPLAERPASPSEGDEVIVAGAGQEPVPEEFEHRLETGLASPTDVRLRPGTSASAKATADKTT